MHPANFFMESESSCGRILNCEILFFYFCKKNLEFGGQLYYNGGKWNKVEDQGDKVVIDECFMVSFIIPSMKRAD